MQGFRAGAQSGVFYIDNNSWQLHVNFPEISLVVSVGFTSPTSIVMRDSLTATGPHSVETAAETTCTACYGRPASCRLKRLSTRAVTQFLTQAISRRSMQHRHILETSLAKALLPPSLCWRVRVLSNRAPTRRTARCAGPVWQCRPSTPRRRPAARRHCSPAMQRCCQEPCRTPNCSRPSCSRLDRRVLHAPSTPHATSFHHLLEHRLRVSALVPEPVPADLELRLLAEDIGVGMRAGQAPTLPYFLRSSWTVKRAHR